MSKRVIQVRTVHPLAVIALNSARIEFGSEATSISKVESCHVRFLLTLGRR